jgi:glycosyl transferase family 2
VPPLVSMIMPVWRPKREWLLQAVGSALGQRDCELELIVVDDGTGERVESLLSGLEDPRLQILRIPHGGPCRARNTGIAAAQGDLVRFLDSDDVYIPESTARLVRLVQDGDVIAYGSTMFCDETLQPVWKMTCRIQGWAVERCLLSRFHVRIVSMLFPRQVIEATGEWDPEFRVSGDWDYVLRALEHAPIRGEDRVASCYRRHTGSLTGDIAAGKAGARRAVSRYFERHPEQRGTRLERRVEAMLEASAARVMGTQGQPRESLRRLRRAFFLDPRAVTHELGQGVPALWGRLRYKLSQGARSGVRSGFGHRSRRPCDGEARSFGGLGQLPSRREKSAAVVSRARP